MMGRTHALSAGVAGLTVAIPVNQVHHLSPVTILAGTVVAAGAGLLPDLDHPSATPARAFGPISQAVSRVIAKVSGGHRRATHSLLGVVVAAGLATASAMSVWTLTALVWICLGLAVRVFWRRPRNRPNGRFDYRDIAGLVHAAAAAVAAWLIVCHVQVVMLPVAVVVGYLTHLVGDSATESGVNWLWPKARRFRFATIDTGKTVERRIVMPGLVVAFAVAVYLTRGLWNPT